MSILEARFLMLGVEDTYLVSKVFSARPLHFSFEKIDNWALRPFLDIKSHLHFLLLSLLFLLESDFYT
jgi:hypothetical protein